MKRQKVKAKRGVTAERASQATCRQQISWRCHCTFPLDASEYYHTVHGVKEKKKVFARLFLFVRCGKFVEPLCFSVCWLPVFVGQRRRCFVAHLFVSPCLLARFALAALFARDVCCLPAPHRRSERPRRAAALPSVCAKLCVILFQCL